MQRQTTKYFQNCLGVFQGGGCKGPAYIGAFEEITKRGVSFSSLVGTSVGSIIAALIAAGATPSQLNTIIEKMNSFLSNVFHINFQSEKFRSIFSLQSLVCWVKGRCVNLNYWLRKTHRPLALHRAMQETMLGRKKGEIMKELGIG
jgi:predicted acylesterase/phospholipase RssA